MWKYEQSTGKLFSPYGDLYGIGYSGRGEGVNDAALEKVHNVGPIPLGKYNIGHPYTHRVHGPLTMDLTPQDGTEMFGRLYPLMTSEVVQPPGAEPLTDCHIIIGPLVRQAVASSHDRELLVVE